MARAYDAVVVGAGPAGLAASAELGARGLRTLLVEQGRGHAQRDRDDPDQILSGVGGAGLFSDGKLSFYPSASAVYRLPDREVLGAAYRETAALLARHGVSAPPAPSLAASADTGPPAPRRDRDGWSAKPYPSIYASLAQRAACVEELVATSSEPPWVSSRVVAARRSSVAGDDRIVLEVDRDDGVQVIETKRLVVAAGRLASRWTRPWLEQVGVNFSFQRLEIGVRVETASDAPLFAQLVGVDPKLTTSLADGTEVRTFCTCRDGEVVLGETCGIRAVSGRADGPRTGRSSVGVLCRVVDEEASRPISSEVFSAAPFRVRLDEALAEGPHLAQHVASFGQPGAALVAEALARFVARFPELRDDREALVHGPCIEGAGDYPVASPNLAVAPGVWVAGDACGAFRGIVASLVSGRYVGALAAASMR